MDFLCTCILHFGAGTQARETVLRLLCVSGPTMPTCLIQTQVAMMSVLLPIHAGFVLEPLRLIRALTMAS